MKNTLTLKLLLLCCLPVLAQKNSYLNVLKASLKAPGIKTYLPRNSENKICLETIFTNGKLPGNLVFELEGRELALLSDLQPEALSDCQASLEKFKMGRQRAKVKLTVGEGIQLKFVLRRIEEKWYTKWLYTKLFIPVGDEIEVQRTVEKYTY